MEMTKEITKGDAWCAACQGLIGLMSLKNAGALVQVCY